MASDWIDWPLDKPLPDGNTVLDAGELGMARVVEAESGRWGWERLWRIKVEIFPKILLDGKVTWHKVSDEEEIIMNDNVTYEIRSEKESRALLSAALAAGWSLGGGIMGGDGTVEGGVAIWKKYPWMLVIPGEKRVGWNLRAYDNKVVNVAGVIEAIIGDVRADEEFKLRPIKGEYESGVINYNNKTVTVGCCTYPFSSIIELSKKIQEE